VLNILPQDLPASKGVSLERISLNFDEFLWFKGEKHLSDRVANHFCDSHR
jgi:hypothetical protein